MKKILLLATMAVAFSSCATIFTGSKKKVTFVSEVKQPVSLTVDGYRVGKVTLPYTMKIKGGFDDTIVKAETEGYSPSVFMIDKTFNAVAIINLFDIFGWAIDAATGAMMKPEFKFYEIEFIPEN